VSFPEPPQHPEIPYPFPPGRGRPQRTEPVLVPVVPMPEPPGVAGLRDRRTLMVSGPLDAAEATRTCAELMSFDGSSDDEVLVVLNSPGGPLREVAPLLDVLDAMRAPVSIRCIGAASGTAAVLLACASGTRSAAEHASISLRCDHPEPADGPPRDLQRHAEELQRLTDRLAHAVAGRTRMDVEQVRDELDRGPTRRAGEALELGLVDEVLAARAGQLGQGS